MNRVGAGSPTDPLIVRDRPRRASCNWNRKIQVLLGVSSILTGLATACMTVALIVIGTTQMTASDSSNWFIERDDVAHLFGGVGVAGILFSISSIVYCNIYCCGDGRR